MKHVMKANWKRESTKGKKEEGSTEQAPYTCLTGFFYFKVFPVVEYQNWEMHHLYLDVHEKTEWSRLRQQFDSTKFIQEKRERNREKRREKMSLHDNIWLCYSYDEEARKFLSKEQRQICFHGIS